MKQATHFIEQVKYLNGDTKLNGPAPIKFLNLWNEEVNNRLQIKIIAIFKIYPK